MRHEGSPTFVLPRPGPTLRYAMFTLLGVWIALALGVNWAGPAVAEGVGEVLRWLRGDTAAVLKGEVWRLVTAALLHDPGAPGHLLFSLLGLYFLAPTLEDHWGSRRMLTFLLGAAALAFALQTAVGAMFPSTPLYRPHWFGALGVVEAIAVAWALTFRGQTVRLFFVLPVSSRMLLVFIVAMSILNVLAARTTAEGLVTPFGGMLAGWVFSDGTAPRRAWLRLKLRVLQSRSARLASAQVRAGLRRGGPPLRVIRGGDEGKPPKDKRFLN